jgi:hypothetical protein
MVTTAKMYNKLHLEVDEKNVTLAACRTAKAECAHSIEHQPMTARAPHATVAPHYSPLHPKTSTFLNLRTVCTPYPASDINELFSFHSHIAEMCCPRRRDLLY